MTITDPEPAAEEQAIEPYFAWLDVTDMAPHPDNPRVHLGDLTELVRSIKAKGVLENLTVTPPGDDGIYLIGAGKRRWNAAIKAGVTKVPATIRPLTTAEVIELGLVENGNRADLTLSEELAAIERLMTLDTGLTPAKLCKRIGRSQSWVKARMAVTVLPPRWRTALDKGQLSLTAAEAAASAADLGPEHLDAMCESLSQRRHHDPARAVNEYRENLRRAEQYQAAVDKARAKFAVVYTKDEPPPDKFRPVGELFDTAGCKAHAAEPCHAVHVQAKWWSIGVEQVEGCTDPRRHAPSRVGTKTGSDLVTDRTPSRGHGGDDSHAKRKGRLSRQAHAAEVFAKTRGGFNQADLTQIALRGLLYEAGRDELKYAATVLGVDQPGNVTVEQLLAAVDTPAALARVAGAVAMGQAETRMYWTTNSPQCRAYVTALTGTGWTPDDWTATRLANGADDDEPDPEPDDEEADDDEDPEPGDVEVA